MIRELLQDETGASSIEYGLIAFIITFAIIVGVSALGDELRGIYEKAGEGLEAANFD